LIARVLRPEVVPPSHVSEFLDRLHYLGRIDRGIAWSDAFGVMVWTAPTSRRLPAETWLELARWCLIPGQRNAGSQQFARVRRWLLEAFPDITTLVSYSDPGRGHTGALYRACGWIWAPTWHRLRPPPSGNGDWGSGQQDVKDRWYFPLRPDPGRAEFVRIKDDAVVARLAAEDA
jgi:hypothetical protein